MMGNFIFDIAKYPEVEKGELHWTGITANGILIVLLADGVQGMSGGREAALHAVGMTKNYVSLADPEEPLQNYFWAKIFGELDISISSSRKAGLTGFTAVASKGSKVVGASCGESHVYFFVNDRLFLLTADQRKKDFLGTGTAFPFVFESRGYGKVLVASDGLTRYIPPSTIKKWLKDGFSSGEMLRSMIEKTGGEPLDQVTIIKFDTGKN